MGQIFCQKITQNSLSVQPLPARITLRRLLTTWAIAHDLHCLGLFALLRIMFTADQSICTLRHSILRSTANKTSFTNIFGKIFMECLFETFLLVFFAAHSAQNCVREWTIGCVIISTASNSRSLCLICDYNIQDLLKKTASLHTAADTTQNCWIQAAPGFSTCVRSARKILISLPVVKLRFRFIFPPFYPAASSMETLDVSVKRD